MNHQLVCFEKNRRFLEYQVDQELLLKCNMFFIFSDVDECCVGTFCPVGSTCSNSLGGFDCTCNDGFFANGTSCDGNKLTNFNNKLTISNN